MSIIKYRTVAVRNSRGIVMKTKIGKSGEYLGNRKQFNIPHWLTRRSQKWPHITDIKNTDIQVVDVQGGPKSIETFVFCVKEKPFNGFA